MWSPAQSRPVFGALLRSLRIAANLSQEQLAERAFISKQAVSSLERGTRRAPQRQTLAFLMQALALDADGRAAFEAAAVASASAKVRRDPRSAATDAVSSAASAAVSSAASAAGIPNVPTSFIGRENDCAKLAEALRPGTCVTIWGSGGIGKTRLIIETARREAQRFPGGIRFVELAQVHAGGDVASAIATVTNTPEEAHRPILDSVAADLCAKGVLLVLDNAEHLVPACARVVERLLRDAPDLAIVCTSREILRIAGETVFALGSLPIPDARDPALAEAPAVRLFTDRAASAGVRVATPSELQAVATICGRLDAVPLALELAAARTPLMHPTEIAANLDQRFRLLTLGARTASARHQTLRGVLEWSVGLLGERERIVFRRLAVWPNTWTLDDAVAVATDETIDRWTVIDAVGRLVDGSLAIAAESAADERRFRFLQSTRAFALDRAAEAGDSARCSRSHAERMHALAFVENEAWRGRVDDSFRRIDAAALHASLSWTLTERNDVRLGARIAGLSALFWPSRGMRREGVHWLDAALAALGPDDVREAAEVQIGRARFFWRLHAYDESYDAATHARELAEGLGDDLLYATALLLTGDPAAFLGRYDEAVRVIDEAAAIFKRMGDGRGERAALFDSARIAHRNADYAEARDRLTSLLADFRDRGEESAALHAAIDLGETEFHLGNTAGAIATANDALAISRRLRSQLTESVILLNLAAYHLELEAIDEAMRLASASLAIAHANGYDVYLAFGATYVAQALTRSGRDYDAAVLCGYADRRLAEASVRRQATEERWYARTIANLAATLGPEELQRARDDGAALDRSEAAALAREAADGIYQTQS